MGCLFYVDTKYEDKFFIIFEEKCVKTERTKVELPPWKDFFKKKDLLFETYFWPTLRRKVLESQFNRSYFKMKKYLANICKISLSRRIVRMLTTLWLNTFTKYL